MARILFLAHRLPYPPNKGDKVRSYHLLRHLAQTHEVVLGTFVDDPDDLAHVPTVRQWCAELKAIRLHPGLARVASLAALARREPLTLAYYRSGDLAAWVRDQAQRRPFDAAVVFSSSMAPYAQGLGCPVFLDLVDVDSAKWSAYAGDKPWPLSWLYRREGQRLLAYERASVAKARASFLVTDQEVALFERLAPECRQRVTTLGNGVDAEYFAPDPQLASPFDAGELPIVFTGAMDYWPNVDAVSWFASDMLPALRQRWPLARLHIVGRQPTPQVQALAGQAVNVTGTVPDVRPYLQHAAVVVAPLRLARGVQNKILEAMAMARPVVAASSCVRALDACCADELLAAETAEQHVQAVHALLEDPGRSERLGQAARARVLAGYGWGARLAGLDRAMAPVLEAAA